MSLAARGAPTPRHQRRDRDHPVIREPVGMAHAGRLRPAELAEAVVLADLSLALTVVGQVVPFGGALLAAAVVPLAVVGARHRLRAVIAGAVAAAAVGFLVIGTAALTTMAGCAAFGAIVGAGHRRRWSLGRTMAIGIVSLWPPVAVGTDVVLLIFSDLRKLTLDQIRNGWKGLFHLLHGLNSGLQWIVEHPAVGVALLVCLFAPLLRGFSQREQRVRAASAAVSLGAVVVIVALLGRSEHTGDSAVTWIVDHWWLAVPIAALFTVIFGIWLAHALATPALRRVSSAFAAAADDAPRDEPNTVVAPVPVALRDVAYRYPGADADALVGVTMDANPGELLVIAGRNGSGKSTLARIVAGRRTQSRGLVERPGAIGLGAVGGTAFVFQRPEAQVLGVRVRDDVVWGLRDASAVDIDAALARVGLEAFADRETSTLSGGELQRLAIAAAIARAPRLFVSDESTAMVDSDGRAQLVALLRDLADEGVAVVHVSHYANEAALADRIVSLERGRLDDGAPAASPREVTSRMPRALGPPVVELRNVGHVYSRGTPWAHRALAGIDLTIHEAESVLVVGHNGSGKSTLAWIVAGLTSPSEGDVHVDGTVGLSFQHARLQLLRPTVLDEVHVAAGIDHADARRALAEMGLDDALVRRRVDELSGGQMRRVVLAEVLARRPRALVLDEPFAGLDADGRADLESLLLRLRDQHGIALLIVSHDRDLPPALVEREVELSGGRLVRDERAEREVPT